MDPVASRLLPHVVKYGVILLWDSVLPEAFAKVLRQRITNLKNTNTHSKKKIPAKPFLQGRTAADTQAAPSAAVRMKAWRRADARRPSAGASSIATSIRRILLWSAYSERARVWSRASSLVHVSMSMFPALTQPLTNRIKSIRDKIKSYFLSDFLMNCRNASIGFLFL